MYYIEHYLAEMRTLRSTANQYDADTIVKTQDILRKILALGVACAELHGIRPRQSPPANGSLEETAKSVPLDDKNS